MRVCPVCKEDQAIVRMRRTTFQRLLSLFQFFPFRCESCGSHFYAYFRL